MKHNVLIILLILIISSCGINKQLSKEYKGKPASILEETFGKPKSIIEKDNGKVYLFEIEKKLERAEINQGKLSLDPMVTPKVKKTERYYFTVENGIIISAKFEEEYKR